MARTQPSDGVDRALRIKKFNLAVSWLGSDQGVARVASKGPVTLRVDGSTSTPSSLVAGYL